MQDHCKLEEQYCQRRLDKLFQPLFDSTGHCPATEIGSHREGIGGCTYDNFGVIVGLLADLHHGSTIESRGPDACVDLPRAFLILPTSFEKHWALATPGRQKTRNAIFRQGRALQRRRAGDVSGP